MQAIHSLQGNSADQVGPHFLPTNHIALSMRLGPKGSLKDDGVERFLLSRIGPGS